MKATKAQDLRTKSKDELQKQLLDLRKTQLNLRFQRANGQLENTAQVNVVRKNIARIKTLLGQMNTETDGTAQVKTKAPAKKAPAKAKTTKTAKAKE